MCELSHLRCLSVDVNCIEAQRLLALSLLTRDGNFNEAAEKISGVVQLVDRCEPSNHGLYYNTSLALARLVSCYYCIARNFCGPKIMRIQCNCKKTFCG